MNTYQADSVESAIELARKFQREGKYDWFRGQLHAEWKLQSSLARAYENGRFSPETYQELCGHFAHWVEQNENIKHYTKSENIDLFFAVMQHYGIPTHYIDFTDDPGIAGFFASDGGSENDESFNSIIYLINTREIQDFFKTVKQIRPEYHFELIDVNVNNLWRLHAQRGKFIYSNIDWAHFYYPPDRIIFPYTGMPSAPQADDIYPKLKSHLEQQLDQWFFLRRCYENDRMLKSRGITFTTVDAPEGYKELVENGVRWPEDSIRSWLKEINENFLEMDIRRIQLKLRNNSSAPKISTQIVNGIKACLERQPNLRKSAIEWQVFDPDARESTTEIVAFINQIWNGMRPLPFSNDHIYSAIEKCITTFEDSISYAAFDKGEQVEFGLSDGSYSRARVISENLLTHMSNAVEVSIEEVSHWRTKSAAILMKYQDPCVLFAYDDFVELFACELIPSQILEKRSVVIFNPAKVTVFGLA